jgi:hypothetical protein
MTELSLSGNWQAFDGSVETPRDFCALEYDSSDWPIVSIPSHWQSHAPFINAPGPMLMRRNFTVEADPNARSWLVFDGVFTQAGIWVDGSYTGDIDGYFAPHSFEVTTALSRTTDHTLALEISSPPAVPPWSRGNWGPGGIWRDVRILQTGPVRIARTKVLCVDASADRAVLSIAVELNALTTTHIHMQTRVSPVDTSNGDRTTHEATHTIAPGRNRLQWTVVVDDPALWWPWELGEQPLYDVDIDVSVLDDKPAISDSASIRTGLRELHQRDGLLTINGERLFLRDVFAYVSPDPADGNTVIYAKALQESKDAGGNLVHVQDWVEPPEFYRQADEMGMLIWQGAPSEPNDRETRSSRLARQAVEVLGHHPSIATWLRPQRKLREFRPKPDALKRTFERADPSRASITFPEAWNFSRFTDDDLAHIIPKWAKRSHFVTFVSSPRETARQIDVIRRFKYQPVGGFLAGYAVPEQLDGACDLVRVMLITPDNFERGRARIDVYVINDLRTSLHEGVVTATVRGTGRPLTWSWAGDAAADSSSFIGRMEFDVPELTTNLHVDLALDSSVASVSRTVTIAAH